QHLSLARVQIDLPSDSGEVFRLSVKKEGVEATPEFVGALEAAADDGGRLFTDYIADAQTVYREARKRSGTIRKAVIPAGAGFAPEVRETLEEELPQLSGEQPIEIRWRKLDEGVFFDLDREQRLIVLNKRFRTAVLGGRRGSLNDAPMVKSLLYLLAHQMFESEFLGSRAKDNLPLWQAVLTWADRAEVAGADESGGDEGRSETFGSSCTPRCSPTLRAVGRNGCWGPCGTRRRICLPRPRSTLTRRTFAKHWPARR